MNRFLQFCILSGMCLLLYACPMQTNVPIDSKPHNIDTILLGKWRSEKKDNSYMDYLITKRSATQYAIKGTNVHAGGYSVEYYYAYSSKINGDLFLSIFSKDTSNHGYYLTKINFASSGNTMKISSVSDKNKETFYNSEELRQWIINNKNKPDFFDSTELSDIFHRIRY